MLKDIYTINGWYNNGQITLLRNDRKQIPIDLNYINKGFTWYNGSSYQDDSQYEPIDSGNDTPIQPDPQPGGDIPVVKYTIEVSSNTGGSISTNTQEVEYRESAVITIIVDDGYKLNFLTVNGINVTSHISNNQYIINNITENKAVYAEFSKKIEPTPTPDNPDPQEPDPQEPDDPNPGTPDDPTQTHYILTIFSSFGGHATYNNEQITGGEKRYTVTEGSSHTIYITPDQYYYIEYVLVNNVNATGTQIDLEDIDRDIEVYVKFDCVPNKLIYNIGEEGSVKVTLDRGNTYTTYTIRRQSGEDFALSIAPDVSQINLLAQPGDSYRVKHFRINDVENYAAASEWKYKMPYSFSDGDVNIECEFEPCSDNYCRIYVDFCDQVDYVCYDDAITGSEKYIYESQYIYVPKENFYFAAVPKTGYAIQHELCYSNAVIWSVPVETGFASEGRYTVPSKSAYIKITT